MGPGVRARFLLGSCAACMPLAAPSSAQEVLVRGRVEDAFTRAPVAGARVSAPDSTAVFTDSLGVFALTVDERSGLFVRVTQFGYVPQRFDLPTEAGERVSVLLLEPLVFELEAIDVVTESAVEQMFRRLRGRRNAFQGSVMAFDRARIERMTRVGTAWDFVFSRATNLFECNAYTPTIHSGLCVRGRGTFSDPAPEIPVLVCVDAWESFSAIHELETIDIRDVALIEIFARGRGSIRVYTSRYLASAASHGQNVATPLWFGC